MRALPPRGCLKGVLPASEFFLFSRPRSVQPSGAGDSLISPKLLGFRIQSHGICAEPRNQAADLALSEAISGGESFDFEVFDGQVLIQLRFRGGVRDLVV